MAETYEVRSLAKVFTFDGTKLGWVSSRREDSPRWTEMAIYLTLDGKYVLEKIGRSLVTHMPGCPEIKGTLPRFQDTHPGADPDEEFEYHDCVPEFYDFTELLVEIDREWGMVSEDPQKIIEAMRVRNRDGHSHLPKTAQNLLDHVAKVDEGFHEAWAVPRTISA